MSQIELYPYSLPALAGGEYALDVWHVMTGGSPGDGDLPTAAAQTTRLMIEGPRLALPPEAIIGGFPAPAQADATPDRLPWLAFKQETLPWLYRPAGQGLMDPSHQPTWLALLAIKEGELTTAAGALTGWQCRFHEGRPLSEVFTTTSTQASELAATPATVGAPGDLCDQLEMPHLPLWTMVPTLPESGVLAHVRKAEGEQFSGDDDSFVSVLLSTRQLEPSTRYHLFLISLQDRDVQRLHPLTAANKSARFVVLYHSQFKTGATTLDFRQRITSLDRQPWGRARGGGALAVTGASVELAHQLRDGSLRKSLYHGPLVDVIPNAVVQHTPHLRLADVPEPDVTAQGKTRKDISLRAAFELGRLLALSERTWLSAVLEYRRQWQLQRAWQVMNSSAMASQVGAAGLGLSQKKATGGASAAPLLTRLLPLKGMDTLLTAPVDAVMNPARLSPAAQSDPSGIRHLVGRADVPGLDPVTVARDKYGIAAQANAMTAATADSTVLSSLVTATAENTAAAQARTNESKTLPPPPAPTRGAPTAPPPPLVDGAALLKGGSPSVQAKGAGAAAPPPPPDAVLSWLYERCLLRRVPFPYVVPHAAMLPPESLRTFYLDAEWIASLVDGALAAALATSLDVEVAESLAARVHADLQVKLKSAGKGKLRPGEPILYEPLIITGVLLRSAVVSQYPGLGVRSYSGASPCAVLRRDQLSEDTLLVLFYGQMSRLEISEPAQGLLYGASLVANSGAELIWQDPATGSPSPAGAPKVSFGQWDAGVRTLDLGRNTPRCLVNALKSRVARPESHHVAWALQRDPFVWTLDRASGGGSSGGGKGDTATQTTREMSSTYQAEQATGKTKGN